MAGRKESRPRVNALPLGGQSVPQGAQRQPQVGTGFDRFQASGRSKVLAQPQPQPQPQSQERDLPFQSLLGPELPNRIASERFVSFGSSTLGKPGGTVRSRRLSQAAALSRREAAQLAEALGPAIEKTDQAALQGIRCPGVETETLRTARGLQAELDRFLITDQVSFPIEANAQRAATAVLDCAITVDQVVGKKTSGTTALLIGGAVILGLIVVATQVSP